MNIEKWKKANLIIFIISLVILPLSSYLAGFSTTKVRLTWERWLHEQPDLFKYPSIMTFYLQIGWIGFITIACISMIGLAILTFRFHNLKSFVVSCIIVAVIFIFYMFVVLSVFSDILHVSGYQEL
jgi:hypothetical protein